MKKKVLHIVEAFGGGVFTYLTALANSTCEEFDVTIACTVRPQTPENFQRFLDPRVHVIEMQHQQRSISLKKDLRGAGEIREIVKEVSPDIIHLHSSKAGILGRIAINCRKNKVFYTPHGFAFLKKDDPIFVRMIYWLVEFAAARFGGEIIAVSEGEYKEARKLTRRASYINNGIELTPQLVEASGQSVVKSSTKPVIGTLGRVCYQKNPELFNQVAEHLPEDTFIWIGMGEMEDFLKASNVEITGWCEHEEAIRRLEQVDIFLLTSLWEGLPISLLEAMYLKKVCIVTDVIGNRDVIVHGVNGFIGDTAEDIVALIKEIKNGKWDLQKITERAKADVEEKYSIPVMCGEYSKRYREG
ncbi:MAG: glycosyltransferase [Lachnospiraceae bacterium]|nr:glycosyltransferase [Lachnospiraceae bacterium]